MPAPIDPSFAVTGPEWTIAAPEPAQPAADGDGSGGGFGDILARQISNLERLQTDAAEASRQLATGQAEDLPSVINAVERAKLAMELASTIRTKAVEAYQDIWRTQV